MGVKTEAPKKTSAAGAVLAVLLIAALALSHSGGGSSGGHPPLTGRYLEDDPCRNAPDDQLAAPPWHRVHPKTASKPGGTREYKVTCGDWRKMVDDLTFYDRLNPAEWPRSSQVLDCIGKVIHQGDFGHSPGTQIYTLRIPAGSRSFAGVTADAEGFITSVGLHGGATWAGCAGA